MKTTVIETPALCQLPLIDTSHPIIKDGAVRTEWHPARFLVRIVAKICTTIISRVPVGYEDETGFHHGVAEATLPIVRTSRSLNRSPGKTCLKARWKTMRMPNFNSGRQLVLQWDSSSRPPCQLLPEAFEARPGGRTCHVRRLPLISRRIQDSTACRHHPMRPPVRSRFAWIWTAR